MRRFRPADRRTFVAVEVVVLLAIFVALLAFVAIATQEERRRARVAGSVTNLRGLPVPG